MDKQNELEALLSEYKKIEQDLTNLNKRKGELREKIQSLLLSLEQPSYKNDTFDIKVVSKGSINYDEDKLRARLGNRYSLILQPDIKRIKENLEVIKPQVMPYIDKIGKPSRELVKEMVESGKLKIGELKDAYEKTVTHTLYVKKRKVKTVVDNSTKFTALGRADTVVVFDFETTGLESKDRPTEVGAVLIEQGQVIDKFQQLMNPGIRIPRIVEKKTGITNSMLQSAPPCETVMCEFADFIKGHNLVAHNASFDRRFLDAELNRIRREYSQEIACSRLVAQKVYQDVPSYSLENLVNHKKIPTNGVFHRALADAEMTAKLWLKMLEEINEQYKLSSLPFSLMQQLTQVHKDSVDDFLGNFSSTST